MDKLSKKINKKFEENEEIENEIDRDLDKKTKRIEKIKLINEEVREMNVDNEDKSIKEIVEESIVTDEKREESILNYFDRFDKIIDDKVNQRILETFINYFNVGTIDKDYFKNRKIENINIDNDEGYGSIWKAIDKQKNGEVEYANSYPKPLEDPITIKNTYKVKCNIKQILEEIDHSANWLHKKTGIPSSTLSGIINESTTVNLENAYIISYVLGKDIREVFPFVPIQDSDK